MGPERIGNHIAQPSIVTQLHSTVRRYHNEELAHRRAEATHRVATHSLAASKQIAALNPKTFPKRRARVISDAGRKHSPHHQKTKRSFDSRTDSGSSFI